ncbi:MAG: TIGR03960 family B12-binding radical SAM protein [Deltaproteobacteria bacterium]|nr:TIGR03960 family B12-binding radical SAM protein [Deltaproteobacteria bacterium]
MKNFDDILPLVEQPSRYLGTETNIIKKNHKDLKLSIALAFPDLYEIGTSHFGLQILYNILNSHESIAAERVFAPAIDLGGYLRSSNIPLMALESRRPLKSFDIIGFSLLYELNYTNILYMLDLAGIPFFAKERDVSSPLLIAGGPCSCNPEPVADLFDAIVVGDGEEVIMQMSQAWMEWKEGGLNDKDSILQAWSEINGVYIPSIKNKAVQRAIISSLDDAPFPDTPIVPYGRPVHDRLRLEIARGCTRGCRFCQAGMIYRPVRERSPENLIALSDASLKATGYEDISLLSLSTGDYGCIIPLMESLMTRYKNQKIAVSLPSLRADTLTPELMQLVKTVRKTGFTIAPEAGSQRLRDVINKNITQDDVIKTVRDAFGLGWSSIKLYFMTGLPTETDDDLKAIVALANEISLLTKSSGKRKKRVRINVSVSTFIPKSHTPFQWEPQISLEKSRHNINWLKDNLKAGGINFKWQNPEVSLLEGLWSRGDRSLSELLVAAYKNGCIFDGWSDKFNFNLWEKALSDTGKDIEYYTSRKRDMDEPLPWDHINTGISTEFLKNELKKAMSCRSTDDCRLKECNNCGVCDFINIKPKVYNSQSHDLTDNHADKGLPGTNSDKTFYKKIMLSYSKLGAAKYFGHLELANIFMRAIQRAGIIVKFSEGFHPKPKISFADPLPIGMESEGESVYLMVPDNIKPMDVMNNLNRQLPEGLLVHNCVLASSRPDREENNHTTYMISLQSGSFDKKKSDYFFNLPELIITKKNRKGKEKKIDLKESVSAIDILEPSRLKMALKTGAGKTVRPLEVIKNIFSIPDQEIKLASVTKLRKRPMQDDPQ